MARAPSSPARQRGFTLVELFATVAVAAVLAAVALPNLQDFIKNNARSTRINTLVTALNYARGDAVTRRRTNVVCTSADGSTCSGTNQFHTGIVVRTGGNLVRTFPMESNANYSFLGTFSGGAPLSQVSFDATGMASGVANARFTYCDDRAEEAARAVVLSATGHPRTSTDANDDGIHDVLGVNLTCP